MRRARASPSRTPSGKAELDQLHLRHRVEDVQAEEAAPSAAALAQLVEQQRRGRRRRGRRRGRPRRASASSWTFASASSTIASTTRSQSARSAGSVVTRIRSGSPPSSFSAPPAPASSARQAEASVRASRRTSPSRARAGGESAGDRSAARDPGSRVSALSRSSGAGYYHASHAPPRLDPLHRAAVKVGVIAAWVLSASACSSSSPSFRTRPPTRTRRSFRNRPNQRRSSTSIEDRFASGREVDALIAYNREGVLTAEDRARIERDSLILAGSPRRIGRPRARTPRSGACSR